MFYLWKGFYIQIIFSLKMGNKIILNLNNGYSPQCGGNKLFTGGRWIPAWWNYYLHKIELKQGVGYV